MPHEKVYGICENMCEVEVLPKDKALPKDFQLIIRLDSPEWNTTITLLNDDANVMQRATCLLVIQGSNKYYLYKSKDIVSDTFFNSVLYGTDGITEITTILLKAFGSNKIVFNQYNRNFGETKFTIKSGKIYDGSVSIYGRF